MSQIYTRTLQSIAQI